MDRLANPSWQVVLTAVMLLLVVRYVGSRLQSPFAKQVGEVAESFAVALALVFLLIRPFIVQAYYIPSGSMRPTLLERDRILVNKFVYHVRNPRYGEIIVFKSPPSANKDEKDFIKRVIGLPGDEIRLKPGYVTIDGVEHTHAELRELLYEYARHTNLRDIQVKLTRDKVFVDGKEVTKQDIAVAEDKPDARVDIHPGVVLRNGKPLREDYVAEDPDMPYPSSVSDEFKVKKGCLFVMGDNRNESSDSRFWGLLDRKRVEGRAMFIFWPINRIQWLK